MTEAQLIAALLDVRHAAPGTTFTVEKVENGAVIEAMHGVSRSTMARSLVEAIRKVRAA